MTQEDLVRSINTAAAATPAVGVTGHSVGFRDGMVRLAGVEQVEDSLPVHGRGAWIMSYAKFKELIALGNQLIEQVDAQIEKAKATEQ